MNICILYLVSLLLFSQDSNSKLPDVLLHLPAMNYKSVLYINNLDISKLNKESFVYQVSQARRKRFDKILPDDLHREYDEIAIAHAIIGYDVKRNRSRNANLRDGSVSMPDATGKQYFFNCLSRAVYVIKYSDANLKGRMKNYSYLAKNIEGENVEAYMYSDLKGNKRYARIILADVLMIFEDEEIFEKYLKTDDSEIVSFDGEHWQYLHEATNRNYIEWTYQVSINYMFLDYLESGGAELKGIEMNLDDSGHLAAIFGIRSNEKDEAVSEVCSVYSTKKAAEEKLRSIRKMLNVQNEEDGKKIENNFIVIEKVMKPHKKKETEETKKIF